MGNTVLKLAKREYLEHANSKVFDNFICNKRNQSFYLGYLAEDKKYFDKFLKSHSPKCPFYSSEKEIQNIMRHVINATDVAEVSIFKLSAIFLN